jgi:purine nucleosidase
MTPRRVLIDCDPGVDDAVMLIMALASPALDVRAVTTLAGNVPLHLTSRNARMLCQMMGRRDLPVHAGAAGPLSGQVVSAEEFHGASGIEGLSVFEPETPLAAAPAADAIIAHLRRASSGLTIIATGPLTNIALALQAAPDAFANLAELVVMGGATHAGGNITPHAEFNIYADPEAAALVFKAGLPTTVLSLDVTHKIRATPKRLASLAKIDTDRARWTVSLLEASSRFEARAGKALHAPMHDPSTMGWLLAPHLFTTRAATVSVDTADGDMRGKTRATRKPGPHTWVTRADAAGFFGLLEALVMLK